MPSKILNFSKDRLITGINIIDNMLFFVDGVDEESGEPKKINITKFKGEDPDVSVNHSSGTTRIYGRLFEERDITVIKEHPISSLQTSLLSIAGGGGDVIDYGGGGNDNTDDPIDDDPYDYEGNDNTNATSAMGVGTLSPLGHTSIQQTSMRGEVINAVELKEKGIYYTFNEAYSSREELIANVGNGVFKKQDNELLEGFTNLINIIISNDSGSDNYDADGLGTQTGTPYLWYMAYAVDIGGSEVYGLVEGPTFLKDNSAPKTGLLTGLTLKEAKYSGGSIPSLFLEAKYDDDGGSVPLDKGFVISKAYPTSNTAVPTYDTIVQQIIDADNEAIQEGVARTKMPASVDLNSLDSLGQIFGSQGVNEFTGSVYTGALQPGYIYYAYAFVETENTSQGVVVSTNYKSIEIENTTTATLGEPAVKHLNTTAGTDYVILKAGVIDEGDDSNEIVEKGFFVSANPNMINDVTRFKEAFPALASGTGGVSNVDSFPSSDYPKLLKIVSNDSLESDGTGEFQVSTDGLLTLEQGETLRYLAYAKNLSGGISYGSETGYLKTGQIGTVNTIIEEDDTPPSIRLDSIYFNTEGENDDYLLDFSYDISFIPTGRTVQSSGVVFAMPTGSEIANNKHGFDDATSLDNASRLVDKDNTNFTFTANSNSASLGTYKLENLSYNTFSESDRRLFAEAYLNEQGEGLESLLDLNFWNPIKYSLTAYAYVVLDDGQITKTEILKGAKTRSENTSNGFTMDWSCGNNMSWAPCVNTRNNASISATDITSSGLTLQGRFAANSSTSRDPLDTGGLGFYYSTTKKPIFGPEAIKNSTEWYDVMDAWVNDAGTTKRSVSVTTAMEDHMLGNGEDGREWYEYEQAVSNLTSGDTIYFCAFAIPRQRPSQGTFVVPGLTDTWNRTRYGDLAERKLPPAVAADPQEPQLYIHEPTTGSIDDTGTSVTFAGQAIALDTYYEITTRGFYYKLKSIVGANATGAQIKTAMASPANRNQLTTTDPLNTNNGEYGITAIVASGEYYVSAFCIAKANNVNTTFISDFYKELTATALPPQDTYPKVSIRPTGLNVPRVLNGSITGQNINISDRGFYIIGKEGNDLAKPANQLDFMAIYNSPPFGVITHKLTGAAGNNEFYTKFDDQTRGYTYYCIAYAINTSGEEGKSNSIVSVFDAAIITKFILATTSVINFDQNGNVQDPGAGFGLDADFVQSDFSAGDSALVGVSTEKGYDGNWTIDENSLKWKGSSDRVKAYKRIYDEETKLHIPTQQPNGIRNREAEIVLKHGTDPTNKASVLLKQAGSSGVDIDRGDDPIGPDPIEYDPQDITFGPGF